MSDARLDEEIAAVRSVIVETVLSSDKYKRRLLAAHAAGFQVVLLYVTVRIADLNVARVATRLNMGAMTSRRSVSSRVAHARIGCSHGSRMKPIWVSFSTTAPTIVAFKE